MAAFRTRHRPLPGFTRCIVAGVLAAGLIMFAASPSSAQNTPQALYTVNGAPVSPEVQQLMMALNLTPGHYYVDQYGNLGMQGQPPMINLDGGPARMSGPLLGQGGPAAPTQPPPAAAPFSPGDPRLEQQLVGVRLYWMFSSRLGHGGSSGYFHLCPNNVFHRSAEGSFRVGGDYDIQGQSYDPYVAGASTMSESGNWRVEQTAEGTMVRLFDGDGDSWDFQLADIQNGRWQRGDFRYFSEVGQATCN